MPTSKQLIQLQEELTGLALVVADKFNITLDFSHESIQLVEKILDIIHQDFKKRKDEEGLHGLAIEFAAYIVTVIERHFEHGEWQRDHADFGENSFPYHWEDSTIFPYAWCLKRIMQGQSDNVWVKYKAFVLEHDANRRSH